MRSFQTLSKHLNKYLKNPHFESHFLFKFSELQKKYLAIILVKLFKNDGKIFFS